MAYKKGPPQVLWVQIDLANQFMSGNQQGLQAGRDLGGMAEERIGTLILHLFTRWR